MFCLILKSDLTCTSCLVRNSSLAQNMYTTLYQKKWFRYAYRYTGTFAASDVLLDTLYCIESKWVQNPWNWNVSGNWFKCINSAKIIDKLTLNMYFCGLSYKALHVKTEKLGSKWPKYRWQLKALVSHDKRQWCTGVCRKHQFFMLIA